jgi:hypothetical protein
VPVFAAGFTVISSADRRLKIWTEYDRCRSRIRRLTRHFLERRVDFGIRDL